jgi:Uncharacterised protein family (UPF0175)
MEVTVHIPDEAAADLPDDNGELPRKLLEAYALEGYKSGELTAHQIKELLGFDIRLEVDGFLKAHGVPLEFTLEDLERERATLDTLLDK